MRVLLVDDLRDTTFTLRTLLERVGYEVEAADTAETALELAERFAPHVVCLDIGMPGMSGYEIARRIRGNPGLRDTRIVAISGYAPDHQRAAESGIDAYLLKPPSMPELIAAMHN